MPTKEQLQKRVQELEEENDQLQDQLDQIYDIVAQPERTHTINGLGILKWLLGSKNLRPD